MCPSGLGGRIRGLKGKEMKLLSDKRKAKSGNLFDELIEACWLETTTPGPYRLTDKGRPAWIDVLAGDRFYVLLMIRCATYPDEPYPFPVTCSASNCGDSFEWEVPLEELPVRKLSEENLKRFVEGVPFEGSIGGRKIKFVLPTGRHEKLGQKYVRGADADLMQVLNVRITEIEGVDPAKRIEFLEDLELCEHRNLLEQFDSVDCGVETGIEVVCTSCGTTQRIDLPFGPAFFMPRKSRR